MRFASGACDDEAMWGSRGPRRRLRHSARHGLAQHPSNPSTDRTWALATRPPSATVYSTKMA